MGNKSPNNTHHRPRTQTNSRAKKLIKSYQKNHRSLTQSRDDQSIRALFALYDKENVGYLNEDVGKIFISDVLTVSDLWGEIPETDRKKTVDTIFDELDTNGDRLMDLNEFLHPSWGKVQDLLHKAFIKMSTLHQLPDIPVNNTEKEAILNLLDQLEKNDGVDIKIGEPKIESVENVNDLDIKENECSVCMSEDKNSVIIPCGHVSCCFNCAMTIKESTNPICPICDCKIESVHHIFVV